MIKKYSKIKNKIKIDKKIDNLKIQRNNEQKPEIKKIKKQETAKKEYKPKRLYRVSKTWCWSNFIYQHKNNR